MENIEKHWDPEIKPCLQCGKLHTRVKFCSPYCGSKYGAVKTRKEMGVDNPDFSTSNINAIIRGSNNAPIQDNSYGFIFSNKLEDWLGSANRTKRMRYEEKRKAKKIESDAEDT